MTEFLVNLVSFYNDFDFFVFFNNTFFLVTFTSYYFGIKLFTLLFVAQTLIIIFINLVLDKVVNYYSFVPKKNSQVFDSFVMRLRTNSKSRNIQTRHYLSNYFKLLTIIKRK